MTRATERLRDAGRRIWAILHRQRGGQVPVRLGARHRQDHPRSGEKAHERNVDIFNKLTPAQFDAFSKGGMAAGSAVAAAKSAAIRAGTNYGHDKLAVLVLTILLSVELIVQAVVAAVLFMLRRMSLVSSRIDVIRDDNMGNGIGTLVILSANDYNEAGRLAQTLAIQSRDQQVQSFASDPRSVATMTQSNARMVRTTRSGSATIELTLPKAPTAQSIPSTWLCDASSGRTSYRRRCCERRLHCVCSRHGVLHNVNSRQHAGG